MAGIEIVGGNGPGPSGTIVPVLQLTPGDGVIFVEWQSPEGDIFTVFRDDEDIHSGGGFDYQDNNVTNGTRYCYYIGAFDSTTGASGFSRTLCATAMAGAVVTVANRSLEAEFSWSAVNGAFSYNLYFGNPIVSPSLSKATNKAPGDFGGEPLNVVGTSYTREGLSNNCVTYPLEIRPVDIDGNEGVASSQEAEPDTEGTLDTTFGSPDGYVTTGGSGIFTDVAVLDDGTILGLRNMVATDTLTAYDEDGTVAWEVTFDAGDHVMSLVSSLAIDSENRILVGGQDGASPKVCRLIPSGVGYDFDDANFGGGGLSGCSDISVTNGVVYDITFDSQNRIVASGQQQTLGFGLTVWVLINDGVNDGVPDTNFDSNGEYVYTPLISVIGHDVETIFDGTSERIYVAGNQAGVGAVILEIIDDDPPNVPTVTADVDANANGGAWGVHLLDDGAVLFTGVRDAAIRSIYSWLYSDLASPFIYPPAVAPSEIAARGSHVDCRERVIVAGRINDGVENQMMLVRSDETLAFADANFADVGWYIDASPDGSFGYAVAHDARGRLLVGGFQDAGATQIPTLWRLK